MRPRTATFGVGRIESPEPESDKRNSGRLGDGNGHVADSEVIGCTFSEGILRSMIRDKFQVEPSIEYYDAPVIVDNVTSEIIADGGYPNQA